MNATLLLCSDLDRTILPNGDPPEHAAARPLLRRFVEDAPVVLAYVSGRSRDLIQEAIAEYDLPVPDYAVGDVGTSVYAVTDGTFERIDDWDRSIAEDWRGKTGSDLARLFEDIDELRPQEPEKQGRFKRSYYADPQVDRDSLLGRMRKLLAADDLRASLIWSIDEAENTGLLDVLPEQATKLHAIRFLRDRLGFDNQRVVFAGDSGNDLPALTSELQAVLVANARDDVRDEAVEAARRNGGAGRLYLARGGFLGMDGRYAAGVLEGVAHFSDSARQRLERLAGSS